MIKSMTGYGRSEKTFENYKITVEIKSVNNRFSDYNIRLYKHYSFVEDAIRETLAGKISRGKVDVFVQYDITEGDDKIITLNESVAKGYFTALKSMSDMLEIENDVSVSTLAGFNDIFNVEKPEEDKEQIISDTIEVLNAAIDDITANRAREGARLYDFFTETINGVREILSVISERSPLTVKEHEQKMRERIEEILNGVDYDESRLLTEVAIFSDKVNITEELVRFESHLKEFTSLLASDAPVGRKLDFTIQELNREANTMGSKCNDFAIGKAVVDLKSEIEKMREQVQNIE